MPRLLYLTAIIGVAVLLKGSFPQPSPATTLNGALPLAQVAHRLG